jgi:hypothetical protein
MPTSDNQGGGGRVRGGVMAESMAFGRTIRFDFALKHIRYP